MDHEYWLRLGTHVHWHYLPEAMWRETAQMLTRDGWHFKPWWDAFAMAAWGRHYYMLKRRWFAR